ncbi:hypothetical protein F941_00650 [Acinetobacter bouvetii DSM 14964 = CIP 107468]|uniref:DUF4435 domain-containing protein n=1 Tax=Acinetobacter bouvetii DSM 14964 = CIP 107468 TaxID=1120925 RepID=N9DTL0_9GAMM|nr:DUF4435 domain-containing protein [Acinetobacter bouvetii]ENV83818.1 hypothetical protein F941_00650 [Acinetobacter bouvetii DSM 14964 = CIP 107468]BCU65702.1 hypothetical protein ACBO_24930 [Acinetobacter bouvetii]
MSELKKLSLPNIDAQIVEIESTQSILFIGANGSGKTRLGSWVELDSPQNQIVHRISAQKSLTFPDSTTSQSIDLAEKDLLWGHPQWGVSNKRNKWSNKPATTFQNDFQKLMVYLFSDETEENAKFKRACRDSKERLDPPLTKIDQLKNLWERILPHRELIIGGLKIQTCPKGQFNKAYNSSEMSDGERVIFYLIGQCLAAPKNGILVIDEPEIHLHKSVQIPLWNEIEKLRSDCLFVYLTHDVDFASAKENAKKVWLKKFDGQNWDWEEISEDQSLPNEMLLEILGSRKPIVFVEGENGSFDVSLYREILSDFLVIPRGSCTQVIQSVKALKANSQLHHLDIYGIIDRDRRPQHEINKLEQDSIYVLNVAEVENLFCTQEVLEIVSNRLGREAHQDFQNISDTIFSRLSGEIETQVALRVNDEIKFLLQMFDTSKRKEAEIQSSLNDVVSKIDVNKLYSENKQLLQDILQQRNYSDLLAVYNRKSLASQISPALGLLNGSLPETVVRLSKLDCGEVIKNALKPYFGNFQQYIN